jgi:translation initiation factor 2B subunit (eIF-2B alpha/beta/delta family)
MYCMDSISNIPKKYMIKIDHIKNDHTNGATYLTRKAIDIIRDYLQEISLHNKKLNKKELRDILFEIANAQPSMASIILFCNQLVILSESKHQAAILESLINYCNITIRSLEYASENINQYAQVIIKHQCIIATYSSSSLVKKFLTYINNKKIPIEVYCSESRPMNEGIALSKYLARESIPTTVMTDASLFSNIPKVDMVIIGSDAISKNGIINKIGTKVITQLASDYDIPIYVLSLKEKILPFPYEVKINQNKNPDEITHSKDSRLHISNYYFDTSPLNLISAIITQEGMFSSAKLISYMKSLRLHPEMEQFLIRDK